MYGVPGDDTHPPINQHQHRHHKVGLHNLVKAFHSARTALYVKMKLAKRGGQPCICLEARVRGTIYKHVGASTD